jgi:HK97 family phage portal protein
MLARDGLGRVAQMAPLDAARMEPHREADGLHYRYQRLDGQQAEFRRRDLFHMPGLSWDGVQGYSVIRHARETIGLGLAGEEHGARFFGNGATTTFVLGTDGKLSDAAFKHLKDQVKEEHTGLAHAWEPWVLEEGLKPLPVSMNNDDAQWLESRKFSVLDVCRWLRIQPHMLFELDRSTNNNIEQQALEFIKYSLLPWISRYEAVYGDQLLGREWLGRGGDLYIKFNVGALERADIKTRFESYAIGRQWAFMNGDKIAELEDWEKFPGGDEYLVPINMTTVGKDGSIVTTQLASRNGKEPAGVTA